jgi:hypothetical protein
MEARAQTRTERLKAALAAAQSELQVAQQARARYDNQAHEYRAMAAEPGSPQRHDTYTNASVQCRAQANGMQLEINALTVQVADLKRQLEEGGEVELSVEQCAAMDDTMGALA